MLLQHQRPGAAGVGFVLNTQRRERAVDLIAFHLPMKRQQHIGFSTVWAAAVAMLSLPDFARAGLIGARRRIFTVRVARGGVNFTGRIQTGWSPRRSGRHAPLSPDGGSCAHIADLAIWFRPSPGDEPLPPAGGRSLPRRQHRPWSPLAPSGARYVQ